ncbi:MAG: UDP-2,3-diacylglucosamine diphosphatase [Candidatus Dactylopiibacterium sp.]|nr:UDP-2,3-diacylglucosamine diphosphatase [Candidatus Dactylopiibacterium sp.]
MILFISDLHLQPSAPATTRAFLAFLAGPARRASALWILGDLFEFWVGDDDLGDPFHADIADALAALGHAGVAVHIVPGNRDFLLGAGFAARTGARIENEPVLLTVGTHRLVLVHGDAECLDDADYQRYRRRIRSPLSRFVLRHLPLCARRALARRIRRRSAARGEGYARTADLDAGAIASLFRDFDADWMIHGHTHRPALHPHAVDGRERLRWVLADWHDTATWLEVEPDGVTAREGAG